MPTQELARQWFIPGDGIDRHVISTDIQRYLGNDATVRPGRDKGIDGYWIRAYRNLTSAMISDLRSDSARWKQEQRVTGSRDYGASRTYEQASGSGSGSRGRNAESPSVVDTAYGVPSNARPSGRGAVDAMQIDTPSNQPDMSRYGQPSGQPTRGGYPPDSGPISSGRDRYSDSRPSGYQDVSMSDNYGRAPVPQPPFGQDPRYAQQYQQLDGPPNGYVRQGDFYVPITTAYGQQNIMAPSRPDQQQFPSNPYGQPQEPQRDSRGGRDPRESRDPRYGQQDYNEASRYYPSPATTAASVGGSRDTISSPSGPSQFGGMPQSYDQYGRPVQQPSAPYGGPEPGYPQQSREPTYGRQPAAPQVHDRDRDRDARRRRLH